MADWERTGPPPPSAAAVFLQVALGVALVGIGHAVFLGLLFVVSSLGVAGGRQVSDLTSMIGVYGLFGLACAQLIYVAPLIIGAAVIGRRPIALGVIIGAGLTVLLQGGCYGLFLVAASGIH